LPDTTISDKVSFAAAPAHVVAIVNPYAGVRRGQRLLNVLGRRKWSAKLTTFATQPGSLDSYHEAIDFAREAGADRLLVAGGDGTLMEALTAMLSSGAPIPISIVPIGTGNIVAHDLSLPRRMLRAVQQAFRPGNIRWWDVGKLVETDHIFALRASAGHDARTLAVTRDQAKQRWGTMAYAYPALRELLRTEPSGYTLTIDNQKPFTMQGITAFVAVTSRVTGRLDIVLSHDIQPDDGLLHVGVIRRKRLHRNVPLALNRGDLEGAHIVSTFPVRNHVRIDCEEPQLTQVDGELLDVRSTLTVEVIPGAAPFITPV
jgi:diacylglycerol kinase family enzyme